MTNLDLIAFIIMPIIGNFFLVYIFFDFMGRAERTIYKKRVYYIIAYIVFSIVATMIVFIGVPILSPISIVIGILLTGYFLYNNSKMYIIYYFIFAISIIFCDILVNQGLSILIQYVGVYFKSIHYFQIFAVITVRFIESIYAKIFVLFIKNKKINRVTKLQWISFCIIPLISIFYIFTLVMYLQLYAGVFEIVLFKINVVLVIVLHIYTTYIFDTISKNNTLKYEVDIFKKQNELQYKYYDNLEKKYEESRKIIHDIRNHLQAVERLYETKDISKGKEYTNDIHQMLNKLNQKYYTQSRVLNIILNDKFDNIKNTHVEIEYRIGDVDLEFMKDIDITTIFANLIDNAIEASIEVDKKSYIKLDIDKFNDFIIINIINSCNKKPIKKGKRYKTTKKNHQGLGLENIEKTIEKYEGTMVIDYTKSEFSVNILIPTWGV